MLKTLIGKRVATYDGHVGVVINILNQQEEI